MSTLAVDLVSCPRCSAPHSLRRFESLSLDLLPELIDDLLAARLSRLECGCGHAFQAEHPMLLVSHKHKQWIVMQPLADRRHFASLERQVAATFAEHFAKSPPVLGPELASVRPRLVFGQPLLAEALRIALSELDPAIFECAKLLWLREHFARNPELFVMPPVQLVFEDLTLEGTLRCTLGDVATGAALGEVAIDTSLVVKAAAMRARLERQYAELFERPYISASRYLLGDTL
jgi:CpXC protein